MSPDGDLNNPAELNGVNAFDSDGSKIGSVGQVYFDDRTGRPEWVTVKTGMFGMKESLVPLSGSHRNGEGLHHVGYRVDDCGSVLESVKQQGARVVDEHPRTGSRGTTVAFVHPKGSFGTLIELVQE